MSLILSSVINIEYNFILLSVCLSVRFFRSRSDLYLVCRPMYMETSARKTKDLPLADLRSNSCQPSMTGNVPVDTQLTMVLSRRLYNRLSKVEVRYENYWRKADSIRDLETIQFTCWQPNTNSILGMLEMLLIGCSQYN